jgi:hypothetical protein
MVATLTTPVQELPQANVGAREFDPAEFVTVPNVPVFAEHQTETRDGRTLRFGRQELEAVAARCNQRIRDTGDYAAVVIGHTPDPEQAGSQPMPELVGHAGPFRVGLLGPPDRQKHAILADFHVFREDFARLKKFPRRSPELWVEDSYSEMFLDPISLLGAEAPRLDMGHLYSARRAHDGRVIEKYAAVCSAANVSVRGDDVLKHEYAANPQGSESMLDEQSVRQIVDAIEQLPWVQFVKSQMAAEQSPAAATEPDGDEPPPVDPDAEPQKNAADAAIPPVPAAPAEPPAAPAAPMPNAAPVPPMPGADQDPLDKVKYSRLAAELEKVRLQAKQALTVAEQEREKRVNLERYQLLSDKRQVRVFDLAEEHERCKYGRMSDEQFTRHLGLIDANYREIPLDATLPTPALHRPAAGKREQYSREVVDKAVRIGLRRQAKGEQVDFETLLEEAAKGS